MKASPRAEPGRKWLYRTSAAAGALAGAMFLLAVVDVLVAGPASVPVRGGLPSFQGNWLATIFKLHAGVPGLQIKALQAFSYVDLGILVLVAILFAGLYAALRSTSPIWSAIACIQPILGTGLYLATQSAGRSSVMGAGLVISFVMLRDHTFSKAVAVIGVLSSLLLLGGDLSAGIIPPSGAVASLFGLGYLLLIAWLFAVARRLFQLGGLLRTDIGRE